MADRVSVIIPCYNGEAFIDRSIASVYEQDYPDIELIVVDDGSTDASAAHIIAWQNRFGAKGWQLKCIRQENRGLSGAIDSGLKQVTGDYLMLLDADDQYLPDAIQDKANFLKGHPEYVGVRSDGWVVEAECRRHFIVEEREKREDLFYDLLYGYTNNWAGAYMLRTSVLFAFYPNRNIYLSRFGQNLQLLLPVAYAGKFGYIDEPQMEYIRQINSLSKSDTNLLQKSLRNENGYFDIRGHMAEAILSKTDNYPLVRRRLEADHIRRRMGIAAQYSDKSLLRSEYRALKQHEARTLSDAIDYYRVMFKPLAYALRAIRKCRTILHRS